MTATTIATIVLAVVAVLSLVGAILAWLFRRGADEREFSVALRDNADALRELAQEFRKFRDEVLDQVHILDRSVYGLDLRVASLEKSLPPIHVTTKLEAPPYVSPPPDRDSGPEG